jgi:hypothetical protein
MNIDVRKWNDCSPCGQVRRHSPCTRRCGRYHRLGVRNAQCLFYCVGSTLLSEAGVSSTFRRREVYTRYIPFRCVVRQRCRACEGQDRE